jgi:hypothetical protein
MAVAGLQSPSFKILSGSQLASSEREKNEIDSRHLTEGAEKQVQHFLKFKPTVYLVEKNIIYHLCRYVVKK